MAFQDKYTNVNIMTQPEEKDKIPLSVDTYAKCEMIQSLIDQIKHMRINLK